MATIYKYKVEKSSADDVFWFELIPAASPLVYPGYLHDRFAEESEVTNATYEEYILWDEVLSKKETLRPDLLELVEGMDARTDTGASYNPFSSSYTMVLTFDSIEKFNDFYIRMFDGQPGAMGFDNLGMAYKTMSRDAGNTITETVEVDGTLIEFVGKL